MRDFSSRLLDWWVHFGRHDLAWQKNPTPYRVWVSEIMLQQTKVTTAIDYFDRFCQSFPSLEDLAHAPIDQVLAHWSGLGYYARARNLHKTAQICMQNYNGDLPTTASELEALPGIGRSTANAIIAQAHNQRAVILDGNVVRVLTRHRAIQGWAGQSAIKKKLWALADCYTPDHSAANYTQAIMDLGAMVCLPKSPNCDACPVAEDCTARLESLIEFLPTPKPKTKKQVLCWKLGIYIRNNQEIWLEKRPNGGIWGGLWCFPDQSLEEQWALIGPGPKVPPIKHLLTHRVMELSFGAYLVKSQTPTPSNGDWFFIDDALLLGLPRPIKTVILQIRNNLAC